MTLIIFGLIIFIIGIVGAKSGGFILKFKGLIKLGGLALIVIGIITSCVVQINAGHMGVQVLFGKVQEGILNEGLNFVNPLIEVKDISLQTQNYTMSGVTDEGNKAGDDAIRVLSKDGLEVIIDLTVLYRVMPYEAPRLYREIGLSFEDKIIRPMARTGIRESASYIDAISLFSENREAFQDKIRVRIEDEFKKRGIVLEQLLVRNITLPKSVKESIERKITAVQESQRMKFVLEKETQEAERKRVEAQGVADAQKIVNSGLTDKVLQFEMIKVQKELANSQNAKIIMMGGGKSVPFIIGGDK